ncbi:MAG TPA: riboflavin synthase [Candidatus Dormibacteraeota bacterium]|nr:riboflavin synthase [Candidatus Dormibacteraeota bacterium]
MFTGIIEHLGTIKTLSLDEQGGRITIQAPSLAASLAISGSVAVNGCCLTVVACDKKSFSADLSAETLNKTTFSSLNEGDRVNLEHPLTAGKEFGGHFVLGHVDGTGTVAAMEPEGDSWRYSVRVPEEIAKYIVPKGSITIDGISLTVANWENEIAEIAVIPFTYEHTNIRDRKPADVVNLEADILGKYIEQHLEARANRAAKAPISLQSLVAQGF